MKTGLFTLLLCLALQAATSADVLDVARKGVDENSAGSPPARVGAEANRWWRQARETVLAHGGTAPDDYCDVDTNWIFQTLAQLDAALVDDPSLRGEIEHDRSAFATFRETREFETWWAGIDPLPKTASEVRRFFVAHPSWTKPAVENSPRRGVVMLKNGTALFTEGDKRAVQRGRWAPRQRGGIVLTLGAVETRYNLVSRPFYIQRGSMHFNRLQLNDEWTLGSVTHDCDF